MYIWQRPGAVGDDGAGGGGMSVGWGRVSVQEGGRFRRRMMVRFAQQGECTQCP